MGIGIRHSSNLLLAVACRPATQNARKQNCWRRDRGGYGEMKFPKELRSLARFIESDAEGNSLFAEVAWGVGTKIPRVRLFPVDLATGEMVKKFFVEEKG
jgi:hypothetical protein